MDRNEQYCVESTVVHFTSNVKMEGSDNTVVAGQEDDAPESAIDTTPV
jgi:hypothetical protein